MTSLEKRRQELDTKKAVVMARRVTVIMPHYIVLPRCAEHCRQLRKVAEVAILKAVRYPGSQIVVIGDKHTRFGACNAHAYIEGDLESHWGDATALNPVFLQSPAAYTNAPYTVSEKIKQALVNGARDYDKLP